MPHLRRFGRFLHEQEIDSPLDMNENVVERFLAWGNKLNVKGKNWYTDIVQLLRAAPILRPNEWPQIARSTGDTAYPLQAGAG